MALPFFGLPAEINDDGEIIVTDVKYLYELHRSIHAQCAELCVKSQGGYQFDNVFFKMPSHVRKMHLEIVRKMTETTQNGENPTNTKEHPNAKVPSFVKNNSSAKSPPKSPSDIKNNINKLSKFKK